MSQTFSKTKNTSYSAAHYSTLKLFSRAKNWIIVFFLGKEKKNAQITYHCFGAS